MRTARCVALSTACLIGVYGCDRGPAFKPDKPPRHVGLCFQMEGPGPHISAVVVAVPSRDPKWERELTARLIGVPVPPPTKYTSGTWLPVTYEQESPREGDGEVHIAAGNSFNCDKFNRRRP